jgi:ankyrin repeat protein
MLLDCGANINFMGLNGVTALQLAVECSDEATLRLLLDRGADIESRDHNGRIALQITAFYGHAAIPLLHDRSLPSYGRR